MTCEEAIAALQEAKNIFCATGSKGVILAKIKIKLKVLMCCDEEEGGATTTTTTTTSTTTTTTTSTSTSTTTVDESPGLRMVFNDIENMPAGITNPTDVSEWNAFYDLPTNGTPFTSAWVSGNQVTLVGGGAMTINTGYFENTSFLVEIEDQNNIVDTIESGISFIFYANSNCTLFKFDGLVTISGANTFNGNGSVQSYNFPALINAGGLNTFRFNAILETFSAPNCTTFPNQGIDNCPLLTFIDLSSCVNLGSDPADASVFDGITGQVITLNIAAVNATNNAGGVHASVAYLIANNTATVNYI